MSTKDRILRMLLSARGELSGSAIAAELGISRSAVWKAIGQLRAEGCRIEGATNRGYRLVGGGNALSAAEMEGYLLPGPIGGRLEIHGEIGSTNDRARELALAGEGHGSIVLAEQQSKGRGRFGRSFHSPRGSGVYMSVLLRPELAAERAVLLTSMAAVAVARAIEEAAGVEAGIKWVNDVYIGPRKACGILCEAGMDFESGQLQYVVMGIGVNVGFMDFPEELRDIATSLSNECGRELSRSRFAAGIINQLNRLYPGLQDAAFMEEYRRRSNVIGRDVQVLRGGESYPARVLDIDGEGSLVVRTQDGAEQRLHSGEISLRFR